MQTCNEQLRNSAFRLFALYDLVAPPHLPKKLPSELRRKAHFPSTDRLMTRREGKTENSIGRNGGAFIAKVTNQQGLPSPSHLQAGAT